MLYRRHLCRPISIHRSLCPLARRGGPQTLLAASFVTIFLSSTVFFVIVNLLLQRRRRRRHFLFSCFRPLPTVIYVRDELARTVDARTQSGAFSARNQQRSALIIRTQKWRRRRSAPFKRSHGMFNHLRRVLFGKFSFFINVLRVYSYHPRFFFM